MAIDFPATPAIGQQFVGGSATYQWDGTGWNIVPQMGPMSMSDTPPPNPAIGQQWWRTSTGQLYVWYDDGNSQQWVQAAGAPAAAGAWEKVANYVIPDAGVTEAIFRDLGAFDMLRCTSCLHPVSTTAGISVLLSDDNGATFINGATDYWSQQDYGQGSTAAAATSNLAQIPLTFGANVIVGANGGGLSSELRLFRFNKTGWTRGKLDTDYQIVTSGVLTTLRANVGCNGRTTPQNALRYFSSQLFTGHILIEGLRG
jgi:hypothetical protein